MTVVDGVITECVTLETKDRDNACGVVCDRLSGQEYFTEGYRSGLLREWFSKVINDLPQTSRSWTLAFSTADTVILDERGRKLASRLRALGTPLFAGVMTEEDHHAGLQYAPDTTFSQHLAFQADRPEMRAIHPTIHKAIWRGAPSGVDNFLIGDHGRGVLDVQRMHLVNISRAHPNDLDAKISKLSHIGVHPQVMQLARVWFEEERETRGMLSQKVLSQYTMHVSVDGFGTTAGLLSKLHGRAVVLKVSSSAGTGNLTEWWYHGFNPWKHYIPVNSNLSDLLERIAYVRANPKIAERIADNAATTAAGLTYNASVAYGATAMKAILHCLNVTQCTWDNTITSM